VLSVEGRYREYWEQFYGTQRVITLPDTELLAPVEAAIIGLTEGTLNLQNTEDYLKEEGNLKPGVSRQVMKAIAGIPIGAQAVLPNFNKLPVKGDRFRKKLDLWPVADAEIKVKPKEKKKSMWT